MFIRWFSTLAGNRVRALLHVKRDLLLGAAEGECSFDSLVADVEDALGSAFPEKVPSVVLCIVRELLDAGLVRAADLSSGPEPFECWPHSPAEAVERIERRWQRQKVDESLTYVVWFIATETGREWVERYYALVSELGADPEAD